MVLESVNEGDGRRCGSNKNVCIRVLCLGELRLMPQLKTRKDMGCGGTESIRAKIPFLTFWPKLYALSRRDGPSPQS